MEGRTWLRFGEKTANEATQNGTADTKESCENEAEMLNAGHNRTRDQTDDETDNYRPDDV
jgi:hypothetical protein